MDRQTVLGTLLVVCVAALVYLRRGWEYIDLGSPTLENIIVLALFIVMFLIGAIFLSPYFRERKRAFQEANIDKKKLFGGKDLRR
jgi:cell division protein FtsW (lipid II flippase)